MENGAKNVAIEFLTAVQQGDNAKLGALLSPTIQWNQPGDNQIAGIKNSSTEVFGMVGKMFELTANTLRLISFKTVSVNGNKVACVLHWTGTQPAGGTLDVENIDIYTVENGQIIKAEIFSADLEQENEIWGK